MRALRLLSQAPIHTAPLSLTSRPNPPDLPPHGLLLRVEACGVCHTDLHIVEGDLPPKSLPITPGHQVVGRVVRAGDSAGRFRPGERVGVTWLAWACGACDFCRRGEENLCAQARFTGWDVDGGYADYMQVDERYAVALPAPLAAAEAAPLLCAGVIGYRALRLSDTQPGEHLGLFGFGASAHIVIQIARRRGCTVSVFTRGARHRALAESLGAAWTGGADQAPPQPLDRAILFAPAGDLVPLALARLRPGGTLAINAVHLSPIPALDYGLLYGERTVRSVANVTRRDADEFLPLAASLPIQTKVQTFPIESANAVLGMLKAGAIDGAAVLVMA